MQLLDKVIVEQKLYKNAGLKLEQIAKKVHIPVNTISGIINQSREQNFSQYLNGYRIEAAKKLMRENSGRNIKLSDIFLMWDFTRAVRLTERLNRSKE